MLSALILSAVLMGLAGAWHCTAMCGPAATGLIRRCNPRSAGSAWSWLMLGRVLGYALAGAIAATGMAALGQLGAWSAAFKPLWVLTQLLGVLFGLWLMIKGSMPLWLDRTGRADAALQQHTLHWVPQGGRLILAGGAWALWPCTLLHAALLVAALANQPLGGALVMASFALASAPGLLVGDLVFAGLSRLAKRDAQALVPWLTRASGLLLFVGSSWAIGHGLFAKVWAWCVA